MKQKASEAALFRKLTPEFRKPTVACKADTKPATVNILPLVTDGEDTTHGRHRTASAQDRRKEPAAEQRRR
jgi:hypothetical protein